jgi:hypothetical protein
MGKSTVTRRDFLRLAALSPLAAGVACSDGEATQEKPGKTVPAKTVTDQSADGKARVVLVRNESVLVDGNLYEEMVQKMLDDAVTTLWGETDPVKAWKKVFGPEDVVGIKNNVWGHLPTTSEVENALTKRLTDAGVKKENIGIDDRGVRSNPIFKKATALINARPGRTHHWSGVGSLIKNYIMFDAMPFSFHGDSCASLGQIWLKYKLKEKTRLNVLVMFTPLFHGVGPHHFNKKYTWEYKGILVGTDPVAVDTTGVRILLAKRKEYFNQEKALAIPAKHIQTADTDYGLGVSDPAKIEVVKVGWKKGTLI